MSNLISFLKQKRQQIIYFKPNPGNGGDALIAYTTLNLFKSIDLKYKIITGREDLKNQIVIFGGGGNFIEKYSVCSDFISKHHSSAKELIILPHTISGHKELISQLGENVTIFCRDNISKKHITQLNEKVRIYYDDDIVINHFSSFVPAIRFPSFYVLRLFFSIIKKKMQSPTTANFRTLYIFRTDSEKTNTPIPFDNIDLSEMINYCPEMLNEHLITKTIRDLVSFMKFFKTIHTNRLHMAILAGILGKQVLFYRNSYFKNEEIYKGSLNQFKNIQFITE